MTTHDEGKLEKETLPLHSHRNDDAPPAANIHFSPTARCVPFARIRVTTVRLPAAPPVSTTAASHSYSSLPASGPLPVLSPPPRENCTPTSFATRVLPAAAISATPQTSLMWLALTYLTRTRFPAGSEPLRAHGEHLWTDLVDGVTPANSVLSPPHPPPRVQRRPNARLYLSI
ncbi:hypothetical protein MSAN_02409100 [Mycena sanguinolenta]|uniref:Uncharacterized protein n=1 Tax=Mycena sanguinolenta TaxID=230812 RepID=A0A8H6X3A9_9AGAR|nr:hypothetical protein MSAN_02409100 [Mycena sanguinolenta]